MPEISKKQPRRKKALTNSVIQETKNVQRSTIINVSNQPNYSKLEGSPLAPEKELLKNYDHMLSKRTSSKKVSNSTKQLTNKKRTKVAKKKVQTAENEALQTQLNTLQAQLSGLQQQLNILPQQLNAMNMTQSPQAQETQPEQVQNSSANNDIIAEKAKSNQNSVLPKTKKVEINKK